VESTDAYLSRRSLLSFRRRLVETDSEMKILKAFFNQVTNSAIKDLKISTSEQRVDSTLVTSNIQTAGRVDLFKKTLLYFVHMLRSKFPDRYQKTLPEDIRNWSETLEEKNWFGMVVKLKMEKKRRLLSTLADWLYDIQLIFQSDNEITSTEHYNLVKRLLSEHCEIVPDNNSDDNSDDNSNNNSDDNSDDNNSDKAGNVDGQKKHPERGWKSGSKRNGKSRSKKGSGRRKKRASEGNAKPGKEKIRLLEKVARPSESMGSPYDPDAGFSGHKGRGYFAHISETCNNKGTEIITDFYVEPAATDKRKEQKIIEQLEDAGKKPSVLYADAGYPVAADVLESRLDGTEIISPITLRNQPEDVILRDRFKFDKNGLCTACPAGHAPVRHGMRTSSGKSVKTLHAFFTREQCGNCRFKERCSVRPASNGKRRQFHIEIAPHLIDRDNMFIEQQNRSWWDRYNIRAGIEATISELKRGYGLGKLRFRKQPKVTCAISLKIIACNSKRWISACA